ncbi:MAG: hypothetical protein MI725_04250 [Pirellulales bacterium]|nr:hypothetical protein [Pirellulales bacterium]
MGSKVKAYLRAEAKRTKRTLTAAIGKALQTITQPHRQVNREPLKWSVLQQVLKFHSYPAGSHYVAPLGYIAG